METANILDLVLLSLIGFAIFRGYVRGLVGPVLGIIAVCLGGMAAWLLYLPLSKLLPGIETEIGRKATASIIVFVIVAGAATWVSGRIQRGLSLVSLSKANRLAGAGLGAIRVCLLCTFLIRTLYFHPAFLPVFQRSLMAPVVLYGGFAVGLFVPSAFKEPQTDTAEQIYLHKDVEIWVASDLAADGTLERTIRITGGQRLHDLANLGTMLPSGPAWTFRRDPASPGRVEIEATGTFKSPREADWALSRAQWSKESRFLSSAIDFEETFDLRPLFPSEDSIYMPRRRADEEPVQSLLRALAELQDEVSRRVSARFAESIVIPVHVRCTFPYSVGAAAGPGMKSRGNAVTWDFDLDMGSSVKLTAGAAGRAWFGWMVCAAGLIAVVGVGSVYVRGKIAATVREELADDTDWGDGAAGGNPKNALPI